MTTSSKSRVLLLIDLLGVKARWHAGGRKAAEQAFGTFEQLMRDALDDDLADKVAAGLIEADSAAFVCSSLRCAVSIGRRVFVNTFLDPQKPTDERLWLRGVIVPFKGAANFRRSKSLSRGHTKVNITKLHGSLLDAVAAEKSGYRGMRLLVGGGEGAGDGYRRRAATVEVKEKHYPPFLRVRTPPYPEQLRKGNFYDFLWMATSDVDEAKKLSAAMQNRIKWAANDAEEFLHAASTQVIFNHWHAFTASLPDGQ